MLPAMVVVNIFSSKQFFHIVVVRRYLIDKTRVCKEKKKCFLKNCLESTSKHVRTSSGLPPLSVDIFQIDLGQFSFFYILIKLGVIFCLIPTDFYCLNCCSRLWVGWWRGGEWQEVKWSEVQTRVFFFSFCFCFFVCR